MYKICIPQIYKVKLVNWWKKSLKSYHNQEAHLDPHQTSMMKLLYENNERFLVKISSIKYVKWVLNKLTTQEWIASGTFYWILSNAFTSFNSSFSNLYATSFMGTQNCEYLPKIKCVIINDEIKRIIWTINWLYQPPWQIFWENF